MIPLIGAGISLAGSLYAQQKAKKANDKRTKIIKDEIAKNEAEYLAESNKDFLSTAQARGQVTEAQKFLQNAGNRISTQAARNGGTAEAQVASEAEASKTYADALNNITQQGTAYHQWLKNRRDTRSDELKGLMMDEQTQRAQNAAQMTQNAGSAIGNLAQSWAYGGFDNKPGEYGLSFNNYKEGNGLGLGQGGGLINTPTANQNTVQWKYGGGTAGYGIGENGQRLNPTKP